jgi:hypothetical protein
MCPKCELACAMPTKAMTLASWRKAVVTVGVGVEAEAKLAVFIPSILANLRCGMPHKPSVSHKSNAARPYGCERMQ